MPGALVLAAAYLDMLAPVGKPWDLAVLACKDGA